jgi:hypothetical protein
MALLGINSNNHNHTNRSQDARGVERYYSPSTLVSNTTHHNPRQQALCPTKCSKILGQNGTWIQD